MAQILKAVAFMSLAFTSGWVVATPIDYTVDVFFDGGGPSGAVSVNVTLDGVTGTDVETFTPTLGNLLAFDFAYSGESYGMPDDSAFPAAPLVALEDGVLTDLIYMGRKSLLGGRISHTANIELNSQTNSTAYAIVSPGRFTFSSGEVAQETWQRVSAPVGAPATFALLCLGMTGIGMQLSIREQWRRNGLSSGR